MFGKQTSRMLAVKQFGKVILFTRSPLNAGFFFAHKPANQMTKAKVCHTKTALSMIKEKIVNEKNNPNDHYQKNITER